MKSFSIIAAVDKNFGLGRDGRLPWCLSADMQHFKEITSRTGKPAQKNMVIMGRKTWESLPERFRPLPGRENCVLTRRNDYPLPDGVRTSRSLSDALEQAARQAERIDQIFVIGGADVYAQAIAHPACRLVFLTRIDQDFDCDVFFPFENLAGFRQIVDSPIQKEGDISFCFCQFERSGV